MAELFKRDRREKLFIYDCPLYEWRITAIFQRRAAGQPDSPAVRVNAKYISSFPRRTARPANRRTGAHKAGRLWERELLRRAPVEGGRASLRGACKIQPGRKEIARGQGRKDRRAATLSRPSGGSPVTACAGGFHRGASRQGASGFRGRTRARSQRPASRDSGELQPVYRCYRAGAAGACGCCCAPPRPPPAAPGPPRPPAAPPGPPMPPRPACDCCCRAW